MHYRQQKQSLIIRPINPYIRLLTLVNHILLNSVHSFWKLHAVWYPYSVGKTPHGTAPSRSKINVDYALLSSKLSWRLEACRLLGQSRSRHVNMLTGMGFFEHNSQTSINISMKNTFTKHTDAEIR